MLQRVYTYNYEYLKVISQIDCGNYKIISATDTSGIIYQGVIDSKGSEMINFSPEIISIKELKKNEKIIDRDFLVNSEDGFTYHYKLTPNKCMKSDAKISSLEPFNNVIYTITDEIEKKALYNFNTAEVMTPYVSDLYYSNQINAFKFYDTINFIDKVTSLTGTFDLDGSITYLQNVNTKEQYHIDNQKQYKSLIKKLSYQLMIDTIKENIKNKTKRK